MAYTQEALCNIVNHATCCSGRKGVELLEAIHSGDNWRCCFNETKYLLDAIDILGCHIPAGENTASTGQDAYGFSHTIRGFDPILLDLPTTWTIVDLTYESVQLLNSGNYSSLEDLLQAVLTALETETGEVWEYEAIDEWNFWFTTSYTLNGNNFTLQILVIQEFPFGNVYMDVTVDNGIAPATPVLRTEEENCFTEQKIQGIVGKLCSVKFKSGRPVIPFTDDITIFPALRNLRERESGN